MPNADEWVLSYSGTSYSVGLSTSDAFFMSAPEFGDPEIRSEDVARPRGDGLTFGVDYRGGRTVSLEIGVLGTSELDAMAKAGRFQQAWRGDAVRLIGGSLASLVIRPPTGQNRLIYGRPRRIVVQNTYKGQGFVSIVADFATIDDLFYADADQSTTVTLVPPSAGGIIFPLTFPMTTTQPSTRPAAITVDGDLPACPVVTVVGPIVNPTVEVANGWSLALRRTMPAGEQITFDTRPWRRRVTRDSDGASFAGALTQTSRLSKASLAPGNYTVALRGTDATGTSYMRFTWRPTYASL